MEQVSFELFTPPANQMRQQRQRAKKKKKKKKEKKRQPTPILPRIHR
jgi:hypothetical protein